MAQDGSTCGRSKPSSVTLCFGQIAGFARADAGRPWSNSDTCSGVYLAYTRRIPGEYPGVRPATNCPLNPPGRRTSRVECVRQVPRAQLIPLGTAPWGCKLGFPVRPLVLGRPGWRPGHRAMCPYLYVYRVPRSISAWRC